MLKTAAAHKSLKADPIMAHLIESGSVTLEDIRDAEKTLLQSKKERAK